MRTRKTEIEKDYEDVTETEGSFSLRIRRKRRERKTRITEEEGN